MSKLILVVNYTLPAISKNHRPFCKACAGDLNQWSACLGAEIVVNGGSLELTGP
jgi:hypothetical protein